MRTLPGMPDFVMDTHTGRWYEAWLGDLDDTVWAGWTCPIELLRKGRLDEMLWQSRKVSEFYAARETYEERQTAKATA